VPTRRARPKEPPRLDVTFERGTPLAAYLHLDPARGASPAHRVAVRPSVLVDYAADGSPIGLELTAPERTDVAAVNDVLRTLGVAPIGPAELAPLGSSRLARSVFSIIGEGLMRFDRARLALLAAQLIREFASTDRELESLDVLTPRAESLRSFDDPVARVIDLDEFRDSQSKRRLTE
jgi:hypothetical protein